MCVQMNSRISSGSIDVLLPLKVNSHPGVTVVNDVENPKLQNVQCETAQRPAQAKSKYMYMQIRPWGV